jgi:hypothetical protein
LAGGSVQRKASTYTGQHKTERRRQTSMPRAGFEPAIPMFERPKTVLGLDRAAIETGNICQLHSKSRHAQRVCHARICTSVVPRTNGLLRYNCSPLNLGMQHQDHIGIRGFDSRRGLGGFLFSIASRPALGLTEPPIQWIQGYPSPAVKRPGREADHSPLSSAEVKNAWTCTSTPQYVFTVWCLVKHRDNFTFIIPLLSCN